MKKKGFAESRKTNHRIFHYHTKEGKRSRIYTMFSMGKSEDLGDPIISMMARQLNLNKAELIKLIDCPLSQDDYEAILFEKGLI